MDKLLGWVSFASNVSTILASGIAIYIFVMKRHEISSIVSFMLNYTHQISLSEVKEKIERLNEYNAKDPEQCENIVNIFNEIIGQIRGNDKLKSHFSDLLSKLETLSSDKRKLTEPKKRALVSELRERLRHLNVKSIDNLVGDSE